MRVFHLDTQPSKYNNTVKVRRSISYYLCCLASLITLFSYLFSQISRCLLTISKMNPNAGSPEHHAGASPAGALRGDIGDPSMGSSELKVQVRIFTLQFDITADHLLQ